MQIKEIACPKLETREKVLFVINKFITELSVHKK